MSTYRYVYLIYEIVIMFNITEDNKIINVVFLNIVVWHYSSPQTVMNDKPK